MNPFLQSLRGHSLITVVVVAFALCVDYLLYGLVIPLLPYSPATVADEFHAGLLYGGYAIGVLLATPLFGYLGDRQGCKKPMIYGAVILAVSAGLFCFGTNFYILLCARILQGASSAATWTTGMALVAEHYVEKRVQMLGFAMVGSTAGLILGPILGGWLYGVGGYYVPFLIVAMLIAISLFNCSILLMPDKPANKSTLDLRKLLLNRSVIVTAIAVAVAATGWGIIEPLLPNFLSRSAHTPPTIIGIMFTVATIAYALVTPVVGKMSEKHSVKKTVVLGMVLMALTLPLLSMFPNTALLTGAMLCLVSMSYAFVLNPTSAELGNAVDRSGMDCYAAVYAVYNIAYSVGMIGSDIFAAEIAPNLPFLQTLLCFSAVFVLCIPIILKGVADSGQDGDQETREDASLTQGLIK